MPNDPVTGEHRSRPTMYVMVGLPASGKTTRARQLETDCRALRLSPDEWMIPLFAQAEAGGKRDVLEGRLVWLAIRILEVGVDVIVDFGVWSKDERSALRHLAAQAGADCELVYLAVEQAEQRHRVDARFAADPQSTLQIHPGDLALHREQFQAPDHDELTSQAVDPPPAGYPTWTSWAAERWPTSTS